MEKQSKTRIFGKGPYRSINPNEIEASIRKISITIRNLRRSIGLRTKRIPSGALTLISRERQHDLITKSRQMRGEAAKIELELDKMMEVQDQFEHGFFDEETEGDNAQ